MNNKQIATELVKIAKSMVAEHKYKVGDKIIYMGDKGVVTKVGQPDGLGGKGGIEIKTEDRSVIRLNPNMTRDLKRASESRQAFIDEETAAEVIEPVWNKIHDISSRLEEIAHKYDVAASYAGKPAERDAKKMMALINQTTNALNAVASKFFANVVSEERKFVSKHGTPEDYADRVRREIFPI